MSYHLVLVYELMFIIRLDGKTVTYLKQFTGS